MVWTAPMFNPDHMVGELVVYKIRETERPTESFDFIRFTNSLTVNISYWRYFDKTKGKIMEVLKFLLYITIFIGVAVLGWCVYNIYKQNHLTDKKFDKEENVPYVGFWEAFINYFTKAFDFKGCATRAEYWWMVWLTFMCAFVGNMLFVPDVQLSDIALVLLSVLNVFTLIAGMSLITRRMHDMGRSGWDLVCSFLAACGLLFVGISCVDNILFVSVICSLASAWFGLVLPIIWLATPSKYKNNKYKK